MLKTPRDYAFLIATVVLLAAGLLLAGTGLFPALKPAFTFIIAGIVLFAVTFFVVRHLFIRFIFRRINPIYRTLHSSARTQKLKRISGRKDIVEEIHKDVQDWADKQSEEIKKLKQLEKYRKEFLGNVSHELKTPIFNIQGYILTLLDGGMEDSKINRLYLERTEQSINRLISIINDLDAISRLESGEFKLQKESFNIVKLVEDVFESLEMKARQSNIKLTFDQTYSKPIRVYADKKKIIDVIINLVVNTINYGRKGGKTVVSFIDTGENILVDVTDNGIGIDEEDLPRIFDRFYRTDKSRSRYSGGTGLGLSIVKHIVQAHNQTINVRSKLGEGTSFIFSLDKG
ncbi:MAG: sensor histidine kinase [Bacteroidales bacterium]|nr:sensor histidine kinase [Bacteroidales bacterium]MBN2699052.1 sensor histidine kinase [Bacteroidales bacterium]